MTCVEPSPSKKDIQFEQVLKVLVSGQDPVGEACLEAPGVSTWPAYITAVRATNETITVSIDFDDVIGIDNADTATAYADIAAAFAADAANLDTTADGRGGVSSTVSFTGVISNDDELAIISATACDQLIAAIT